MIKSIFILFLLCLSMIAKAQQPVTHNGLSLTNAWLREPPRAAKVAGGFITITNNTSNNDRLLSATAPFANRTEVHEMAHENGVMRMRELPKGIEVKAGETLTLKPGSFHLMFMDLKTAPKTGEKQKIELIFEKAGKVTLDFSVESIGAKSSGHHH
jgi:hypothetical protein